MLKNYYKKLNIKEILKNYCHIRQAVWSSIVIN